MNWIHCRALATALTTSALIAGCRTASGPRLSFDPPPGLPRPAAPADDPPTRAKAELGYRLYFDKRLSRDGTVACATCHDPRKGWTDRLPTPIGVRSQHGDRNAPTVLNAAYMPSLFWDGRAATLEDQAKEPIANPREMDLGPAEAAARIAAVRGYRRLFRRAFADDAVTIDRIARAIATFERTVLVAGSAYDRYAAGDATALSVEARRGLTLFRGKAGCARCHPPPLFTDGLFHNVGVGMRHHLPDLGRAAITGRDGDRGAFKTPTLRNLDETAPYMHDGSQTTPAETLDYFDRGGRSNPWLSPLMKPLGLTAAEKADLLAFLESLDADVLVVQEPKEP